MNQWGDDELEQAELAEVPAVIDAVMPGTEEALTVFPVKIVVDKELVRGYRNRVQLLARKFAVEEAKDTYLRLEAEMIQAVATPGFPETQAKFDEFMLPYIGKATQYLAG